MKTFSLLLTLLLLTSPVFAEDSISTQEGYIESAGAKIYYKRMGKGDPIFVIHGGPGLDHTFFLPQFEALAKNHELIFYDQRGSGKSSENFDPEKINLRQFVDDLENLRAELRLKNFSILGHSWGSILACEYAHKHPEMLSSMILVNPIPITFQGLAACYEELNYRFKKSNNESEKIKSSDSFLAGDLPTIRNFYHELFKGFFYNPSLVSGMQLSVTEETPLLHYIVNNLFEESLFKASYDLTHKLKQIAVPTLVVYGKQDFVPTWFSEDIAHAIPGAQSKALEECGHFSYIEKSAELFNEIDLFLSK